MPDDADAPPEYETMQEPAVMDESPIGFWTDLIADVRRELKPPVTGFFAPTPNAPVQGVLRGNILELRCANGFTMEVVNKPEILALVGQKASAKLGKTVRVVAVDRTAVPAANKNFQELLNFGRAHADVVNIKNNS